MTRKARAATSTAAAARKAAVKPETPEAVVETPAPEAEAPEAVEEPTAPVATDEEATAETPEPDDETPADTAPEAPEPPVIVEVKAEKAFGEDPEDLENDGDDDVTAQLAELTAPPEDGARATFRGTTTVAGRGLEQVAITVIVPDPAEGYDQMVTSGRTYTLLLGKPTWVEKAHGPWLAGHPAYDIEVEET